MANVAAEGTPTAKLPIVHNPVPLTKVPVEGIALTKSYPVGNKSKTDTPDAGLVPKLVAVIVKVTFVPTIGAALFTIFPIDKSVLQVLIVTITLSLTGP